MYATIYIPFVLLLFLDVKQYCCHLDSYLLSTYTWTSIYSIEFLLFSQPNSERWPVLVRQVEAIICSAVACMLLLT